MHQIEDLERKNSGGSCSFFSPGLNFDGATVMQEHLECLVSLIFKVSQWLALDICVSLLRTPKAGNQVT